MGSQRYRFAALGSAMAALALACSCSYPAAARSALTAPQVHSAVERVQQSDRREEARDAARQLIAADALLTGGSLALAIEAYEAVIASYPNAPEAVTARRRILEARALAKSPQRLDADARPTQSVEPAPLPPSVASVPSPPPQPTRSKIVSAEAIAARQNEEFQAAVADRIFFRRNSAELAPADLQVLRLQAQWLLQRKDVWLWLEARADDGDTVEIDAALALERGSAVKSFLVKEGVEARRVRVAVLGRERPVARCEALVAKARQLLDPAAIDASEACAAHNRTVVTLVGPEGLAYEPKIAETSKSSESEAKRRSLSEQKAPVRQ